MSFFKRDNNNINGFCAFLQLAIGYLLVIFAYTTAEV